MALDFTCFCQSHSGRGLKATEVSAGWETLARVTFIKISHKYKCINESIFKQNGALEVFKQICSNKQLNKSC